MRRNRLFRFLGLSFLVGLMMLGYGLYQLGLYDFIEAAKNGRYNLGFNTFPSYSESIDEQSGFFHKTPFHFEESMSLSGQDAIHVNVTSENIYVVYNESDDLKVDYYGGIQVVGKSTSPELVIDNFGDIVNVSVLQNNNFVFFKEYDGRVIVSLPEWYKGDLFINGTSSDVYLAHGVFEQLNIFLTSGNISHEAFTVVDGNNRMLDEKVGPIKVKGLTLNMTSGDASLTGLSFEEGFISSTSGNVVLQETERADTISLNSTSGDLQLSGDYGDTSIMTTSGNIAFTKATIKGDVTLSTTSGDITLEDSSDHFQIRYTTHSGSFYGDDSKLKVIEESEDNYLILIGDANREMYVNTTSGDLNIE